jgi:hypothetical protein
MGAFQSVIYGIHKQVLLNFAAVISWHLLCEGCHVCLEAF